MMSYCSLSEKPVRPEEFDKYYKAFEDKYIGYSQIHDFFSHFDFFDELFANELKNRRGVITIFQKVMECIALHRSITLDQITGVPSQNKERRGKMRSWSQHQEIKKKPKRAVSWILRHRLKKKGFWKMMSQRSISRMSWIGIHFHPSYGLQELSEISDSTESSSIVISILLAIY